MTAIPTKSQEPAETADSTLLERFLKAGDGAAFAMLVHRHGGMVMGLLRRMRLQEADADDAFQAVFVTLARKAGAISKRTALPSWLYKVAFRIALEQRQRLKMRQTREVPLMGAEPARTEADRSDFWAILDAEVVRLAEKYRVPFILCHVQGLSMAEAGERIGCPATTVATRLMRARQQLRSRLARRGLALSLTALTTHLGDRSMAEASCADALLHSTAESALEFGATLTGSRRQTPVHRHHDPESMPPQVLLLSDVAVRALLLAQLRVAGLAAAALALVLAAALLAANWFAPAPLPVNEPPVAEPDWLAQWGIVIDPDHDSEFRASEKTLTIDIPGRPHVLGDRGPGNAPRVIRRVAVDFQVQVKVTLARQPAPRMFEGKLFSAFDQAAFLRTAAIRDAGITICKDDANFLKLGHGAAFQDDVGRRLLVWHACLDGVPVYRGDQETRGYSYLRVERLGPHLFSSCSTDGLAWRSLPTISADLSGPVQVGLFAEHNTHDGFELTFAEYKLKQFHPQNNPQPVEKVKTPPPGRTKCIRCHGENVPQPDPNFTFVPSPLTPLPLGERGKG